MKAISALVTVASLVFPAPSKHPLAGYAAHYSPGLMQQVAINRAMPVVDCMVASPYFPLGTWIVVESQKVNVSKICRVTDLPHPRDRQHIINRGIVVELDFNSAKEICQIYYCNQEPPRACPVKVMLYQPQTEPTPQAKPKPKPKPKPRRTPPARRLRAI